MKTLIVRISEETAARLYAAVPGLTGRKTNVVHSGGFGVSATASDQAVDALIELGINHVEIEATKRAIREKLDQARRDGLHPAGIFAQKARPAPQPYTLGATDDDALAIAQAERRAG